MLLVVTSLGRPADADCVQAVNDVQCVGIDTDGFSATGDGISLTVQPAATVENDGVNPSIELQDSSSATIEQGGTVTATGNSIQAISGGADNTVVNRGDIITSGSGVTAVAAGARGSVVNEATGRILTSTGVFGSTAVGVDTGNGGSLVNDGLIRTSGDDSVGVSVTLNGADTNNGTIEALGTGSRAVAVGSGSTFDNTGTVRATGDDGVGVRLRNGSGITTNSGSIQGGAGSGAGVEMLNTSGTSFFVNLAGGVVSATSGVALQGSGAANQVENTGTLDGDVLLGDGDDDFFWTTGSSVNGVLDGEAGSDDLFLLQADPTAPVDDSFDLGDGLGFERLRVGRMGDGGTWTLTGSGSYASGITIRGGTARLGPGAAFADLVTVLSSATARIADGVSVTGGVLVEGRAELESGSAVTGDFSFEAGSTAAAEGASTLTGSLVFRGGSTYDVVYDATNNSQLDVTGNLTVQPGATLSVRQQDSGFLDRTIRVLTSTGGPIAEFDDVTGGSAFQTVSPTYGSSPGVDFLDVRVRTTFEGPARSPNQFRVGEHLDLASQLAPSADLSAFLASLQTVTGAAAGRQALDALHPEYYDVHTSAALQTGLGYARMLARRPLRCEQLVSPQRRDLPSLEPCGERGFTPWLDAFGAYTTRSGTTDFADWSYGGGGIAFGVDHDLSESVLLSAMLGTSRMALAFDGNGDGSVTTADVGLAGAWHRGGTHVRAVLEYGHGWHETRRHVEIPGFERLAVSEHESERVTALVEAGHAFVLAPFEIEPLAAVEYTFLKQDSLSEGGAGVVGLDLDSRSSSLVATHTGFRAGMTLVKWSYAGPWLEWADGVWRPEITGSWRQVWSGYDREANARLRGAPAGTPDFRTRTQDAQWGADVGARVSFQPHESRKTIELGYEAFVGDGTVSHAAMLRFRMPF